jgi:molecular chaperone DnaJ
MAAQREWFEKDYYRVLGVPETASAKEIKSAFRKLSRQYHPDANPGDAAAEERFKEVSAAYDVVGDAERRKEYDEVRRLGPAASGFPGGGFGQGFGGGGFQFQEGDLGDLLGNLFGRGGRQGARRGTGPHRGPDLEAELHLTFDDAIAGVTTTVHLTSDAPCRTCHGSGARPGTSPVTCTTCNGSGAVVEDQGPFAF